MCIKMLIISNSISISIGIYTYIHTFYYLPHYLLPHVAVACVNQKK